MSSPDHSDAAVKTFALLPPPRSGKRRLLAAAALVGAFAVGGGVTAAALQNRQTTLVMLTPAPITAMHEWSAVAVKGQVAEIFGNKFIIQDETGRALVETGPKGDGGKLVAPSETVTVQGRFEHGFIHAQAIAHGDGRNDLVGPGHGPHGGPMDGPGAPRPGDPRPGDPQAVR